MWASQEVSRLYNQTQCYPQFVLLIVYPSLDVSFARSITSAQSNQFLASLVSLYSLFLIGRKLYNKTQSLFVFSPKIWCPQPMESRQNLCGYVHSTTRKKAKRTARRRPLPVWSNQKLIRPTFGVFPFRNYTESHCDPSSRSTVNRRRKHLYL